MNNTPQSLIYALSLIFVSFQFISCSKDSDLLSDYVVNEEAADFSSLIVNDNFNISPGQTLVLDVLLNDQFQNLENVSITETTAPQNGTVTINENNTLTYTADSTETQTDTSTEDGLPDTFEYTAEETTEEGPTVVETGVVSINNKIPTTGANVFYVTADGESGNDGKSEETSWSLIHAFNVAKAGDIFHVKAGNYGNLKVKTSRSGTATEPIRFMGYTSTPQDIIAVNGPTFDYEDWKNAGNDLPDNIMPHLELNPTNNIPNTLDDAFDINHEYIELHNFMISEYMIGVDINSSNVTVNNVIGNQFGNWNPNSKGWNEGSSFANENNNGYGMNINGKGVTNCNITNNLIINAGHVSYFFVGGGNHLVNNNIGVAHDTGNGSDYIFDFYDSSNNMADNNTGIRNYASQTGHRSRSLILQAQSDNNTITNFTGINCRLQIENSNNNTIRNLSMYTINGADGENSVSIQIYAQADNNIIENFSIDGGGGISFLGANSQGENPKPHESAGENNYFINGKISNLGDYAGNGVINFHRLGGSSNITAGNNYIINLTADDYYWLINANRGGFINIYNSSFSNGKKTKIDTFYPGWHNGTNEYVANFYNCNFYNNSYTTPTGTDISAGNPILNSNLEPQTGSSLIGSGMNVGSLREEATKDFNGKTRSLPYDIGAYEY